jgi:hypothetical protein
MSSLSRYNGFSRFAQSKLTSCWENTEFAWNYRVLQLVCSEPGLTTVDLAKMGFFIMEWHPHIVSTLHVRTVHRSTDFLRHEWSRCDNYGTFLTIVGIFHFLGQCNVYIICRFVWFLAKTRIDNIMYIHICTNMYCLFRRKIKDGGPYSKNNKILKLHCSPKS